MHRVPLSLVPTLLLWDLSVSHWEADELVCLSSDAPDHPTLAPSGEHKEDLIRFQVLDRIPGGVTMGLLELRMRDLFIGWICVPLWLSW